MEPKYQEGEFIIIQNNPKAIEAVRVIFAAYEPEGDIDKFLRGEFEVQFSFRSLDGIVYACMSKDFDGRMFTIPEKYCQFLY